MECFSNGANSTAQPGRHLLLISPAPTTLPSQFIWEGGELKKKKKWMSANLFCLLKGVSVFTLLAVFHSLLNTSLSSLAPLCARPKSGVMRTSRSWLRQLARCSAMPCQSSCRPQDPLDSFPQVWRRLAQSHGSCFLWGWVMHQSTSDTG